MLKILFIYSTVFTLHQNTNNNILVFTNLFICGPLNYECRPSRDSMGFIFYINLETHNSGQFRIHIMVGWEFNFLLRNNNIGWK